MAVGIIAEFNPFHNGHKYLINEAKRRSGGKPIVCIMSGSFVQRGDIAITDKWTRARAALENGADLVIELPVIYSMNTAQKFAYGAVFTLAKTGIADTLAFGSECGDTSALESAAQLLINEPPKVSEKIQAYMSQGLSYPSARERAYSGLIDNGILSTPNDILAVEYLRAAAENNFAPNYIAIERVGVSHDEDTAFGSFASASKIRSMLKNGEHADSYLPNGADFPLYDSRKLDIAVLSKLRSCGSEYMKSINDVSEGLENRFLKAALTASSVDELCGLVKAKRYTLSRIRRIAWSAFIGITKELSALEPSYIRVLGMNATGRALLKQMKTAASLPVIIKAADYTADKIFSINVTAEDIFSLAAPTPRLMSGMRDLTASPVIL
jgi:predicted nucleotidyltransferase